MNRDTDRYARQTYESLDEVLTDLISVIDEIHEPDPGCFIINTADLEFMRRRARALAEVAQGHVRCLDVIPHDVSTTTTPRPWAARQ